MAESDRCSELPKVVVRRSIGRAILAEVVRERKACVRDIVGRYNQPEFVALRVEFIRRAHSQGVGSITIGRIIKRDHTTVLYHLRNWRPRKNAWRAAKMAREASARAQ